MLKKLTFLKPWRCFKDDIIEFHPGVNLLVGDQGTGKSSLFQAIQAKGMKSCGRYFPAKDSIQIEVISQAIPTLIADFEHDNPRIKSELSDNARFQVASIFSSHGQSVMVRIDALLTIDKPYLVLVDEPDMALSIRSCHKLVHTFQHIAAVGGQVIAAVHNPIVIAGFDEVYSLEHRRWLPSQEFIESQHEI